MPNIEHSDILNSIHNLVYSAEDPGQTNNQKENLVRLNISLRKLYQKKELNKHSVIQEIWITAKKSIED